jgi:hypothetical protein
MKNKASSAFLKKSAQKTFVILELGVSHTNDTQSKKFFLLS